jgi:hypothetical protein
VVELVERHGGDTSCHIQVGDDVEVLERLLDGHFDGVYVDTSHAHASRCRRGGRGARRSRRRGDDRDGGVRGPALTATTMLAG